VADALRRNSIKRPEQRAMAGVQVVVANDEKSEKSMVDEDFSDDQTSSKE
jgi:hypothetical protein